MAAEPAQMKNRGKSIAPFIILFVVVVIILYVLKMYWTEVNDAFAVLMVGNSILFLATIFSFFLYRKSLHDNNPNVFVRFVYGGMLLRMVICLAAVLIYVFIVKANVSKFGLFGCFVLYFIYTFAEVKKLMQLSKQQKNA